MEIPVLIERLEGGGYRARGGEPFALSVEGATRDDALRQFRESLESSLSDGAEVVAVDLPPAKHPLAKFAGMFKDDPLFDDWQRSIAEYRKSVDEDPNYR